mmetsp:Transcript_18743/g.38408  ORF Transcript_18743/g.38408 Transcript_18743/m.38408 type:complete len:210 (-) Transcript_18743:720-1349(-)
MDVDTRMRAHWWQLALELKIRDRGDFTFVPTIPPRGPRFRSRRVRLVDVQVEDRVIAEVHIILGVNDEVPLVAKLVRDKSGAGDGYFCLTHLGCHFGRNVVYFKAKFDLEVRLRPSHSVRHHLNVVDDILPLEEEHALGVGVINAYHPTRALPYEDLLSASLIEEAKAVLVVIVVSNLHLAQEIVPPEGKNLPRHGLHGDIIISHVGIP